MKRAARFPVLLLLGLHAIACGAGARHAPDDARVVPNDNRTPAGATRDGVLVLRLELREARWFPDGDDRPGELMQVLAEEGGPPQIPGPLIRVPEGTELRVTVSNPLGEPTLTVYGLHTRPGSPADTIQVPPGGEREVSFTAGEPYRLRIIQINADRPAFITLRSGERVLEWQALAKDGADLPAAQRVIGPATLFAGAGETADFEFTPRELGVLTLEARHPRGLWSVETPILVEQPTVAAAGR